MHVVRHHDPPSMWKGVQDRTSRMLSRNVSMCVTSRLDQQVHGEEVSSARNPVSAITGHERVLPISRRGGMPFAFPPYDCSVLISGAGRLNRGDAVAFGGVVTRLTAWEASRKGIILR